MHFKSPLGRQKIINRLTTVAAFTITVACVYAGFVCLIWQGLIWRDGQGGRREGGLKLKAEQLPCHVAACSLGADGPISREPCLHYAFQCLRKPSKDCRQHSQQWDFQSVVSRLIAFPLIIYPSDGTLVSVAVLSAEDASHSH